MALRQLRGTKILLTPAALGGQRQLAIPMIAQEQTEWCWAACIEMVVKYDEPDNKLQQCELANGAFGNTSCCKSPKSSLCNRPLPIPAVSLEWSRQGYSCINEAGEVKWNDLVGEVLKGRPIECALLWNKGGGHAVLIVGFDEDPTGQWVFVNDPWELEKKILFSELQKAYGSGKWRYTWHLINRSV